MRLQIEIDLSKLPQYKTEPDELVVILHELADWLDGEPWYEDEMAKRIRNFESEVVGTAHVVR